MKLDTMFQNLLVTSVAIVFIITPAKGKEKPEDVQGKSSAITPSQPTSNDTGKVTNKALAVTGSSRFATKSKKIQIPSSPISVNSAQPTKKIPQLSEIEHFFKSASVLVQTPTPSPPPVNEVVPITGVKANPTDKGVEVVLQTPLAQQLQAINRSTGNNFIVDIPNAQLRLPSGDAFVFRSEKPIEGVREITVTNFDAKTVRITVTGEAALPKVEFFDSNEGLIFGLTPAGTAAQSPQPTETPQAQEKPTSETPQVKPSAQQDEPIELVVTGQQDGYRVPNATTGTRTDTPLRDIPQSIQVVPQQVLKDQQVNTLYEALKNVPGSTQGDGSSRSPFVSPLIRGFNANNSILRDGLPEVAGFVTNYDPASIERVEVLKGPASVLYGQGSLGGTINLVTKQPLSEPYYGLEASAGSFNFYSGVLDFSGPLNDNRTLLYRLNAAAQTTESFIDFFDRQRYFIRPALTWRISDKTDLTLDAEYFNVQQPLETGVPAVGTVLSNPFGKIPRERYVGEPSDEGDYNVFRVGYNLEHRFSDNWRIKSIFRSSLFHYERESLIGIGLDENRFLRRLYQNNDSEENIYNLDTYTVGNFSTGSIQHQLLTGFNLSRRDSNLINFNRAAAQLDLFNPVYGQALGDITSRLETSDSTDILGIYVQDQVTLAENLKLLLGLRFDTFKQITEDRIANTEQEQSDSAFSPRVGIVYQPIPAISLYGSYSRSFTPSIGTAFDGSQFQPEEGTQYEVGAKVDLSNKLSATLAFYDLTRSNVLTTDPVNSDFFIQTGKQQSQGIELDISGEILPGWNIIAGYAYTDARIEEDLDFPVGNFLNNVPKHSFNLWTTYEIQSGNLRGLGFGAGFFYVGDREGDLANTFELPSYFRTDAAIFYRRDTFRIALNFKNLFDIEYFESAQNRNRVFYGDPFIVQGTISWQF
ncbi:TonB-dependent siderophore receptor [Scytonema sp. NUACC21]